MDKSRPQLLDIPEESSDSEVHIEKENMEDDRRHGVQSRKHPHGKTNCKRSLFRSKEYIDRCLKRCDMKFTAVKRIKAKEQNRKKTRCPVTKESEHNAEENVSTTNVQRSKTVRESQTDEKDWRSNNVDIHSDSDSEKIIENMGEALNQLKDAVSAIAPESANMLNARFEAAESDCERDPFPHISDNDEELDDYNSESDTDELDDPFWGDDAAMQGRSIVFNDSDEGEIVYYAGQQFHNAGVLRHAIKATAARDGFNLCQMANTGKCIAAECSDIHCEWELEATKVEKGPLFQINKLNCVHTCVPKVHSSRGTWKWIAYYFLQRWKKDSKRATRHVGDAFHKMLGQTCPLWKLKKAERLGLEILGLDHGIAYNELHNFILALAELDTSHKAILETRSTMHLRERVFEGLFVCFRECVLAFKSMCRPFIAVDGWELGGEYGGIMFTAVGLDANEGIWPVAVYEVDHESQMTWTSFFEKLGEVLRLDNGEGICVLHDGDHGVSEAMESVFCRAEERLCAMKVFERMKKRFPCTRIAHCFWRACRSTSEDVFKKMMQEIRVMNEECHSWLMESRWDKWAVHCMPVWAKSTHVTNKMSMKFRVWMQNYYAQSITKRFNGLATKRKAIGDRRYSDAWKCRDKLTPVVRRHVMEANEAAQDMNVGRGDGMQYTVEQKAAKTKFYVHMGHHSCSCGMWQISGIPCAHAFKCISHLRGMVEDFVHPLLKTDQVRDFYAVSIQQMPVIEGSDSKNRPFIRPPREKNVRKLLSARCEVQDEELAEKQIFARDNNVDLQCYSDCEASLEF